MYLKIPFRFFGWLIARKKYGKDQKFTWRRAVIFGTEMELYNHQVFPLNKDLSSGDLLGSIFSSMEGMEWHERAAVQILAKPVNGKWQAQGRQIIAKYVQDHVRPTRSGMKVFNFGEFGDKFKEDWNDLIEQEKKNAGIKSSSSSRKAGSSRKTPLERKEITGASEKNLQPGYEIVIRIGVMGNHRGNCKNRLKALSASFNELDKENKLTRKNKYYRSLFFRRLKNRRMYVVNRQNIMVPTELSKFFVRMPGENHIKDHPLVEALLVKEFATPRASERKQLLIGENTYRGKTVTIGIKPKDLKRHMVIQGNTGSGKSEWAKGFMVQCMEMGMGMALLEPHGQLSTEILQLVPEDRMDDVVIIDILSDYIPGMNICNVGNFNERRLEEETEKTAKEVIKVFRTRFSESWSGKNASYLENAIKTVVELNGGTLVDIRRLFHDKEFRDYAASQIKDPNIKLFWKSDFAEIKGKLSPSTISTVSSVDYKLSSFLNSKPLLRAIGQSDAIDYKEILDKNKILIFRFDKDRMSEEYISFLGSMAISSLMNAAFKRDPKVRDIPFPIFMDEAQNFVGPDIKTILFELRKYGTPLVILHQILEQFDKVKGLKDAVYGNVGTIISFTAGEPDAPFFSKVFGNERISNKDMENLPSRYGYVKLLVDGHKSEVFNIHTLDRPEIPSTGRRKLKKLIDLNKNGRLHYKEIDKVINKRMNGSFEDIADDIKGYDDIDLDSELVQDWSDHLEETSAYVDSDEIIPSEFDKMVDDIIKGDQKDPGEDPGEDPFLTPEDYEDLPFLEEEEFLDDGLPFDEDFEESEDIDEEEETETNEDEEEEALSPWGF